MTIGELIAQLKSQGKGLLKDHFDRKVVMANGSGGVKELEGRMVFPVRDADDPAKPTMCFVGTEDEDMPENLVPVDAGLSEYYSAVSRRLAERLTQEEKPYGERISRIVRAALANPAGFDPGEISDIVAGIDRNIAEFFKNSFCEVQYYADRVEEAELNAKHLVRLHMIMMIKPLKYQDMPPVANEVNYIKCKRQGPEDEDR